jgi:chromosome segregation ATPase
VNSTQVAAINEEIAETQTAIDNLNQLIADTNLSIIQAKKGLSIYSGQLQQAQAKLAALQEGLA